MSVFEDTTWRDGDEFPLAFPLELKNIDGHVIQTIASVKLKQLRGADVAAVANASQRGPGDAVREMVCRLCSIPPSTFDQLDARDITALAAVAAVFTGSAPATGVM